MTISKLLAITALCMGVAGCGGARDISGAPERQQDLPTIGALAGSLANVEAKRLFGAETTGTSAPPAPFGSYAKGCIAGAVQLPETGPTWQAMRLSRNRNWGHPELVDMVKNLSRVAAQQPGWSGIYVGDMSQPRGGPMLTGHRSHQIGLDADIWMLPPTSLTLTRQQRENISSISTRRSNGAYVNGAWTRAHHEVMKAAAQDPRVSRIFVFPGAKVQICDDERGDRSYLRKIRPWYGHHYHFHIRLACPAGTQGCVNQEAPPPGDGCDDAREWQANILNPSRVQPAPAPAEPPEPRRELVLADLPLQCKAVLDGT